MLSGLRHLPPTVRRQPHGRGEDRFLTLLAFGRKIQYLCISTGAGRSGLPLIRGLCRSVSGENAGVRGKNASNAFMKCTTCIFSGSKCILKKVTPPAQTITCFSESAAAKRCRRLNMLTCHARLRERRCRVAERRQEPPSNSETGPIILPHLQNPPDRRDDHAGTPEKIIG